MQFMFGKTSLACSILSYFSNYTVGHKKRSQLIFVYNFVTNQRILV